MSQKGLRHFFKERNYAPDYEKINLTYNPITDSLILTHNQYNALIPGFQNRPFTDTDYWQNQSFTISYSFRAQAWVSYHSYLPTYLWYDDNSFLSHKDSGLYRHNNPDSLHTYYGTKYDYIIEYTVPTQHHTIFDTFAYISQVSDDTDTYTPEITFDKLWIYNDTNSSGLQTLESHTPDTIIHNWSNTTKSVIRTDDIYHVSSIRDLSTANKVKSSDWTDTQSSYPIDHVPVNTDPNRYLYLMKNVRGKYFNVRLFFNPEDNYKIVTQMFNTNPRQSHR